ncbi:MAG: protein-L-isoaspartate O-methyltransferase [Pseudorhodoplanes sp.]
MLDFAVARRMMVDGQVRIQDVTDPVVQAAMLAVPRELFMPAGQEKLAYLDLPVAVPSAKGPRRLLTPMVIGRLLQALEIGANDRVLDVGCATGYAAALLGRMTNSVIALEEDPALADTARRALAGAGASHVAVMSGPLPAGWPQGAPYDVILVEGAVEIRLEALCGQLREGGRLACIQGHGPAGKAMLFRSFDGDVTGQPIFDAAGTILPGFAAPETFVF